MKYDNKKINFIERCKATPQKQHHNSSTRPKKHTISMHEAEHFTIEAEHFNIETEHFKVDSDFILEPLDIQRFRLPLIFWPWSKTVRLAAGGWGCCKHCWDHGFRDRAGCSKQVINKVGTVTPHGLGRTNRRGSRGRTKKKREQEQRQP